jgi:hypothetical protein
MWIESPNLSKNVIWRFVSQFMTNGYEKLIWHFQGTNVHNFDSRHNQWQLMITLSSQFHKLPKFLEMVQSFLYYRLSIITQYIDKKNIKAYGNNIDNKMKDN